MILFLADSLFCESNLLQNLRTYLCRIVKRKLGIVLGAFIPFEAPEIPVTPSNFNFIKVLDPL